MSHSITKIDFRSRLEAARDELAEGSLLLIAPPPSIRNSNQENLYRQDSFFYYLSGFDEPCAAILILAHKPVGEQFHVFVREKNALEELWEGKRLGVEAAKTKLSMDASHPIGSLFEKLPDLLQGTHRLYYSIGRNEDYDRKVIQALHQNKKKRGRTTTSLLSVHDSDFIAGRLRLHKQSPEVDRLRVAASITHKAFDRIYRETKPGLNERDIWAMIQYEFMHGGAEMEAYTSIVAGGANACCLHYRSNNAPLKDGELLLIDAGAQFDYYSSDVTRTFPIGKKFTPEQKSIYEIVLASQLAAIEKAVPGSYLNKIFDAALDVLVDGMIDLKFLKQSKAEIIEKQLYKKYFPHNTSHWIGMDVHDVGDYHEDGSPRPLQEGMLFSVEPGFYIDPEDETVPPAFRGVGVRIEDDVLITKTGHEILTASIPKDVKRMENRN